MRTFYYHNLFSAVSGRSDMTWKKLNSVLNKNDTQNNIESITHNNVKLSSCSLANAFNKVFVNLVGNSNTTDACDYIKLGVHKTIYLIPVTEEETISVFRSVNISHSWDADCIQIFRVLYVLNIINQYLAYIFNICL